MRKMQGMMVFIALLMITGQAVAASLSFGHWRVATMQHGHYAYAATVNRRGELFGEFCNARSASCHWLLAVHAPCHFGDVYTVLANSAAGANPVAIFCIGAIGKHTYGMALMNRRRLQASIAHARRVDFALPLDGGGYAFTGFTLEGRLQATALLRKSVAAQVARRRQTRALGIRL